MMPKSLFGPKVDSKGQGGLAVVMKVKPRMRKDPSVLFGPRDEGYGEDEEVSGETMSNEQAMKEAAREVISCMSSMKPSPERLSAALEAHTRAVCAMMEDEEGDSEEGIE
jgi:hypothetical protein